MNYNRVLKILLWIGFVIYIAALTKIILFKLPMHLILSRMDFVIGMNPLEINVVPFKTIGSYFYNENIRISVRNVVGKIVIFFPFGLLLPALIAKFLKFRPLILASFCLSLTFELFQLLVPTLGSFDIDDLILNTAGALLGYLGFKILKRIGLIRKISGIPL